MHFNSVVSKSKLKGPSWAWSYGINTYHHWSCEFKPRSWLGVVDTTLCDTVCQW